MYPNAADHCCLCFICTLTIKADFTDFIDFKDFTDFMDLGLFCDVFLEVEFSEFWREAGGDSANE
jgi:hypothetical protein